MKMTNAKKILSFPIILVLIAAMALCIVGCKGEVESPNVSDSEVSVSEKEEPSQSEDAENVAITEIGEGKTVFNFTVVAPDGKETAFKVSTDKETVGEALLELGLIAGEQGDYGLYVKTVNGITLDYNKDGKYWAFYENGKYAMSGVDTTTISEGTSYAFKAENA